MGTNTNQPVSKIGDAVAVGEHLWKVEDLAVYLGVDKQTIYDWRVKGYGPKAVRLGKYLRWRPATVEAWIASVEETAA